MVDRLRAVERRIRGKAHAGDVARVLRRVRADRLTRPRAASQSLRLGKRPIAATGESPIAVSARSACSDQTWTSTTALSGLKAALSSRALNPARTPAFTWRSECPLGSNRRPSWTRAGRERLRRPGYRNRRRKRESSSWHGRRRSPTLGPWCRERAPLPIGESPNARRTRAGHHGGTRDRNP